MSAQFIQQEYLKQLQHSQNLSFVEDIATITTILSLLISGYQIARHLVNYSEPHIQLYIIRILAMIPVYSISTWFSIMIPNERLTFDTIRDIYEAYVLYIFMQLLIHFLGGENSLIVHLEFKRRIRQPWPLHDLKPIQTDKIFFRRIKQGVLQFVLIKPLTSVIAIFLNNHNLYNDGVFEFTSGYMYISLINNVSVSISLYSLILFYIATEERLKPFEPLPKFICIKATLFFSFWQSFVFNILINMGQINQFNAERVLYTVISIEMVIVSVCQAQAYNYNSFIASTSQKKNMLKAIGYVLNVKDVLSDVHNTFIMGTGTQDYKQLEKEIKEIVLNWSDEDQKDNDQQVKQKYQPKDKLKNRKDDNINQKQYDQVEESSDENHSMEEENDSCGEDVVEIEIASNQDLGIQRKSEEKISEQVIKKQMKQNNMIFQI